MLTHNIANVGDKCYSSIVALIGLLSRWIPPLAILQNRYKQAKKIAILQTIAKIS